jgi:hypothetical protein
LTRDGETGSFAEFPKEPTRSRKIWTDVGKFSSVDRTIAGWNRLPEGEIGTSLVKTHVFRKRVNKNIPVRWSEGWIHGRDSSAGIKTSYRLAGPGSISRYFQFSYVLCRFYTILTFLSFNLSPTPNFIHLRTETEPVSETQWYPSFMESRTMDTVQKHIYSDYHSPSSEPYRVFLFFVVCLRACDS